MKKTLLRRTAMLFALFAFGLSMSITAKEPPPMLKMDYDIQLGNTQLKGIETVTIDGSMELLADTAELTLPAQQAGKAYAIENLVKRGDQAIIRLGYDGVLETEFTGYVRAIYPTSPMKIVLEDEMYLMRRPIADHQFKNATVSDILGYVVSEVNKSLLFNQKFKLVTDFKGLKYQKLVLHRTTGYEVLDRLKNETGIAIYAKGNELHAHLKYTERNGKVKYDFGRNVEQVEGLQYTRAEDIKLRVKVIGKTKEGASVEVEVGEKGGDELTFRLPGVSDKGTLEAFATEQLKTNSYDGYRGNIVAWGIPYVNYGYTAELIDREYPERNGQYYVKSVKVNFGRDSGFRRTVGLGVKV